MRACRVILVVAFAAIMIAAPSPGSNVRLSGAEGHPRERFPLSLYVTTIGQPLLDDAAQRAVRDWNTLSGEALGVTVFRTVAARADAQVVVTFDRRESSGLMGEAEISVVDAGVIALPVQIVIFEPKARGQTGPDVLLYQLLAHELGHALGLAHVRDPRSIMCCVQGSIDFNDASAREAYIAARRHPELRSVRAQLVEHYDRFWSSRNTAR
ncbi:MAG: hypothetical protein DMD81_12720 [Candidatus Rokuibacteriota bacterium]|nr:MAG: hypothetical protein DMD81_12720 [Candidatus Rokubacteria bacterium]